MMKTLLSGIKQKNVILLFVIFLFSGSQLEAKERPEAAPLHVKPLLIQSLPGRIEAESYDAQSGVQTENTSDAGGGLNVGWIDSDDWMDYNLNVSTSGLYTLRFRVATGQSGGKLELKRANGTVIATVDVPATGGWQGWQTVTTTASLTAGDQVMRVFAKQGPWNFNWFDVTAARPLPAKIEAESYDVMSGIQTENTGDVGGGLNVGWIDDNDWLDYNVNVPTTGSYTFKFRIAKAYGEGKIELKTAAGALLKTVELPITGGWQTYQTVNAVVSLTAGDQVLRLNIPQGAWNFNWFEVVSGGTETNPQSVITFAPLSTKTVGDPAFDLVASSTNAATPITFTSSNPSIVSVSNATGSWKATVVAAGAVNITASQAANGNFSAATDVVQTLVVQSASNPNPPTPPSPTISGTKITLDPKRWYQLNKVERGLDGLFDGITNVNVNTGYGKILDNYDSYYPLLPGEQMTLQSIRFFDGEGNFSDHPLTISVITEQWERIPVATFTGDQYNGWVGPDPTKPNTFTLNTAVSNARYLVINAWFGYPTEIELYGSHTPATPTATPIPQKSIKLKDMMGVNAFEWDFLNANKPDEIDTNRLKAIKSFSGIRHYMDWEKLEPNEGGYTFNPVHSGGWYYDVLYQRLKTEGMGLLACLKTLPGWMQNTYPTDQRDSENVPVKFGRDFSDPTSYIEQAKVAFQYAARYGSNPNVNPALLSVASHIRWNGDEANVVKIGLNLVQYIECDNERDKWWKGRKGYQTAREYAANLSAFYDGHKNTMGPGVGVKNADPNMKVVIGGLAAASIGVDYIKGMIDWCKQYRGYKPDGTVNLCWDVLNYHLYSDNSSSSQSWTSGRGAAPEVSAAGEIAREYLKLAHEQSYDMPVWITETGYDFNQGSPLKAIPIGNKSVLQTQADWILRTSLFYARNKIEKVFFYQTYDYYPDLPIQFGSSGLLNQNFTRKPAADFLFQTKKLLGEYTYKQTLNNDPVVDRYELNGKSAFVLLVPDEVGRTAQYTLDLGTAGSAKVYTPKAGNDAADVQTMNTVGGKLTLTVTETPIFVIASDQVVTSSTSTTAATARLGTAELTTQSLHDAVKVYPNPSVDYITIDLENDSDGQLEVNLFHASLGTLHKQVVLEKTSTVYSGKINVAALPDGMYILEIKQGNERAFRKVLKAGK